MPHTPVPADILHQIAKMQRQIAALTRQQNATYTDDSGNLRAQLGLLDSGDYGLAISDGVSNVTELLPRYWAYQATGDSLSSASYVDLAHGSPSVSPVVGSSGLLKVTVGAYMGVNGVAGLQAGGFCGISIDGAAPTGSLDQILYYSVSAVASVGIAGTQTMSVIVSGLTPGPHTLTMKFKTASGGTVTFTRLTLVAEPF